MDKSTKRYPMSDEAITNNNNRFVYHAPKGDQTTRYAEIREVLRLNAEYIIERTPVCREQSLAITKLEEAMFWANAAIARTE